MTTSKPITSHEPRSTAERLEEDALLAGEATAGGLRAFEVAVAVLLGLLVCPPLAILVVVVVVPILVIALVLALLAASCRCRICWSTTSAGSMADTCRCWRTASAGRAEH